MRYGIIFALAAVLLLAGCASEGGGAPQAAGNVSAPEGNATSPVGNATAPQPNGTAGTSADVSAAELESHANETDCWVLYAGKVYDVTDYLEKHGGGPESITPYCGKTDSSFADAFEGKHNTSKVEVLEAMGILKGEFPG